MAKKMDILDRLRDMYGKRYTPVWAEWVQQQCNEGAKEIERLRNKVAELPPAAEAVRE